MLNEIADALDTVGYEARSRKQSIGMACGVSSKDMGRYVSDYKFRQSRPDIRNLKLNWYRRRKNQDIKDKLAIEGVKRGFSVRAEKTMGAKAEYQGAEDQKKSRRFDLSWERGENSREFALAMEIEMDLQRRSIKKDLLKLINNDGAELKVMVCQQKSRTDAESLWPSVCERVQGSCGAFMLSVWVWELQTFCHFTTQDGA